MAFLQSAAALEWWKRYVNGAEWKYVVTLWAIGMYADLIISSIALSLVLIPNCCVDLWSACTMYVGDGFLKAPDSDWQ